MVSVPGNMSRVKRLALGCLILGLAGCGSVESFTESVSNLNPLDRSKDTFVPGERREILSSQDPVSGSIAVNGVASIPAASAFAEWAQPGGNARNNPGHVLTPGNGARLWSASVQSGVGKIGRRISAAPIVYQGRVYVLMPDGEIRAITASSGAGAWRTTIRPQKEKGVSNGGGIAAGQGRILVASPFGEALALDAATGRELWRVPLFDPARSAPVVVNGKMYFVSASNSVYALDISNGQELWQVPGVEEEAGLLSSDSPAVSGSTVIVPSSTGEVIALNTETGDYIWSDAVNRSGRQLAISGLRDVSAHPVVDGNLVILSGVSGQTIAVDLKTGLRRWEQAFGSAFAPVVSGNSVFITDLKGRVLAIEKSTGNPIWSLNLPKSEKKKQRLGWTGPVLAGGSLWVASSDGRMMQINPQTGKLVSTKSIGDGVFVQPIAAGGKMILVSGRGTVSAYN